MFELICVFGIVANAIVFLSSLGNGDFISSGIALFCGMICYIGYLEFKREGGE